MTARPQPTAAAVRNSAEIVRLPSPARSEIADFGDCAASLVWASFPGDSANAKALAASQWARREGLHACRDTFARILTHQTHRIDAQLLFALLMRFQQQTGQPFALGGGYHISITRAVPSPKSRP